MSNAGMGLSYDGGAHWTEPGFEFGKAVWPGLFGDRPPMQATHKVRSRGFQLIVPRDMAIDPFDPHCIAIGHDDTGLEISRDGGTWWEWAYHGMLGGECNGIRAVVFDPAVRGRLFVGGGKRGSHGHVYRSDDTGRTFTPIGIPQLTAEADRTHEAPWVWTLALDPTSPADARTLYAGTDGGLFKTHSGGKSWDRLGVLPDRSVAGSVRHIRLDPSSPSRIYAGLLGADKSSADNGLYRSEDAGATWTRLAPNELGGIKSLAVCNATGGLYAIARGPGLPWGHWTARALWRSDDHGATWRKLNDRLASAVAVHPRDPNRVYLMTFAPDVTAEKTNVYRSDDGGTNWRPIADEIPLSPGGDGNRIVFDPSDPSRFLLAHDSGTYEAVENPEANRPAASAQPTTIRRWTDRTGRHSINARLRSVEGSSVRLERPDGSVVDIALDELSDLDQAYLKTLPP